MSDAHDYKVLDVGFIDTAISKLDDMLYPNPIPGEKL